MIEYKIITPAYIKTVKKIWKKFLQKDHTWHFTLEGSYIELRVAKRILALEKYLQNKKIDFTSFPYKDNIDITAKYQKQFEKIFHGFSELSMVVKRHKNFSAESWDNDLFRVLERCIHLAFNIHGFNLEAEANFLAPYVVKRAYMAGQLSEQLKQRGLKEEKSR